MSRSNRSVAPGQYLGFSLQVNRLLHRLLLARKGDAVSLEVLGDTATHRAGDEGVVLEEAKSRTSRRNPVADRALDLWKTFQNWLKAAERGDIDPSSIDFVLHVNGPYDGAIVSAWNEASSEEDADLAIAQAERSLFGGDGVPSSLSTFVNFVFDPTQRPALRGIVRHFCLQTGTALSWEEMLAALEEKAVPPEVADNILIQLLGWAKKQVDEAIVASRPAMIQQVDFMVELRAVLRRVDWSSFVASFAPKPTPAELERELERTLVRQLELVELDENETLAALSDFLRARTDRILWSANGTIHGDSFDDLEDDLTTAWGNYRRRVQIQARDRSEVHQGQLLLAECNLHKATLQGQTPPGHFIRGSYHRLADATVVGWHPNFRRLLEEGQ